MGFTLQRGDSSKLSCKSVSLDDLFSECWQP